jgi:hypothetical protein
MHRLRYCLFRLLLSASLLGFALAASAHDHDLSPLAGDGLCAICVYAGGTLASAGSSPVVALPPQRHTRPESPRPYAPAALLRATIRIRGPPFVG